MIDNCKKIPGYTWESSYILLNILMKNLEVAQNDVGK